MHVPVLLNEVIKTFDPQSNENFIDATLGEAGHTLCLLQKTDPSGRVLGIDLDAETLRIAEEKLRAYHNRVILVKNNFKNLESIVDEYKFKKVSGILFDLGMSSRELEESGRGFSFRKNEPLLMNFGEDALVTAEQIVNNWPADDLKGIFEEYGEERFSRQIAEKIVVSRQTKPIKTTFDLVEVIQSAVPQKYQSGRLHPATRVFQALRITVNDELNNLRSGLEAGLKILESGGKIIVISFHSLEDRIVKNFFRDHKASLKIITKKPVIPARVEILNNPRARSAKLRAAQKL
ncbi:MAG TPA: 16S rRNA (cytosine(1402)-N(4))-methyltransferase RsmH [Candidatus Paceibacterota bacterium]|nr:16S rRNA (cytosine(1402)-N(4))-methyltransferase RsmH [Candidatus Paceibacterota bacterium]